ncbi:hypothetical protein PR048_023627 [Dryococelus australis]|uniref:Uncharacterized protein n=1 Tax=Dryococelus australis TaxID=614101 RepID=A0ABQ9GUK8_9NEOP|nr:hypothetical protein PR048_023627 [Dryococelus australis]
MTRGSGNVVALCSSNKNKLQLRFLAWGQPRGRSTDAACVGTARCQLAEATMLHAAYGRAVLGGEKQTRGRTKKKGAQQKPPPRHGRGVELWTCRVREREKKPTLSRQARSTDYLCARDASRARKPTLARETGSSSDPPASHTEPSSGRAPSYAPCDANAPKGGKWVRVLAHTSCIKTVRQLRSVDRARRYSGDSHSGGHWLDSLFGHRDCGFTYMVFRTRSMRMFVWYTLPKAMAYRFSVPVSLRNLPVSKDHAVDETSTPSRLFLLCVACMLRRTYKRKSKCTTIERITRQGNNSPLCNLPQKPQLFQCLHVLQTTPLAYEGEVRRVWRSAGMKGWKEREIPEKTRRPAAIRERPRWGNRDCIVVRPPASHLGEPGSISGGAAAGFSQAGIVSDDAAGWPVFSGVFRFPSPFIPALLHTHLASQDHDTKSRPNLFTHNCYCCRDCFCVQLACKCQVAEERRRRRVWPLEGRLVGQR